RREQRTLFGVPEAYGRVLVAAGGDDLAVGREGHTRDDPLVAAQPGEDLAGAHLPDAEEAAVAAHHALARGGAGDREVRDGRGRGVTDRLSGCGTRPRPSGHRR